MISSVQTFTIGYDTALNTAMEAIDKIRILLLLTIEYFFIEVMGRDAGFIALNSGIASGALDILIPEKRQFRRFVRNFRKSTKRGKTSSIVIVAEGERLASTYELAEQTKTKIPRL